ncbi:glycosyltransferase [Microbacterium sp. SORGH_AS_0888]|uniref:glycosyltransferase n=1 Tax=Microbacterium sp. SORGH_AS_0888 TaxID=3041791 RepID=UPI00277DA3A1|nr:glycosyltransferase [Microbacterium sp. SORGH_AS_0888]MDQ1128364.1 glycosyltransferase involved in cell wall biosynthesis [Microbacterium sp. SORGH_AS_0888]
MTTRVLHLFEGFFAGGARILHTDVVRGLHSDRERHSVLSIAATARREGTVQRMTADPRYRALRAAGVDVRSLGRRAEGAPPAPEAFTADELELAAEIFAEADVVVSLKEQPLGLLLALHDRGLLPRVPVAVALHRSDPEHAGPALGWLRRAAAERLVTTTIACAESTADAYAAAGVRAASEAVIANGIDIRLFSPVSRSRRARLRIALGLPEDLPVIVYAARFDEMKDPELFVTAAARHASRNDAHYVLCGAGMDAANPALTRLLVDAGLRDDPRVHTWGIRDDMPDVYRVADIVALTSAYGEASPLCLREGAACGATPVTTDVGDAAREVRGFGAVTPRDPEAIAGTWERVLRHRTWMRRAALAARPRLDRARMLAEYRAVIDALTERLDLAA